jgi:hypothetical protein
LCIDAKRAVKNVIDFYNPNTEQWITLTKEFEQYFSTAGGSEHMLQQFKQHKDHQHIRGIVKARALVQSTLADEHHISTTPKSQSVLILTAFNLSERPFNYIHLVQS